MKPPSRRRHRTVPLVAEILEQRTLLDAGGLCDVNIDEQHSDALSAGLSGVQTLFGDIGSLDFVNQEYNLFKRVDSSPLSIGSQIDVASWIQRSLVQPALEYLSRGSNLQTEGLVDTILAGDGVQAASGGETTDGSQAMIFNVQLQDDVTLEQFRVSLDTGEVLGMQLDHEVTGSMNLGIELSFTFGMSLDENGAVDPEISFEDLFFVRDVQSTFTVDAVLDADVDAQVGFLDVATNINTDSFVTDLDVVVSLDDSFKDANGRTRLSDLLADYSPTQLLDVETVVNSINGTLDISAVIGPWEVSGTPTVSIGGEMVGGEVMATANAEYDQLLPFNNIDASTFILGVDALSSFLSNVEQMPLFDQPIPFAGGASLSDVFNFQEAIEAATSSLRSDETGFPTFDSAQTFSLGSLNASHYDPTSQTLFYDVQLPLGSSSQPSAVLLGEDASPLNALRFAQQQTIASSASADFTLAIDLSMPVTVEDLSSIVSSAGSGEPPESNSPTSAFSVQGFELITDLQQSAENLIGEALYGILGLEIGNASILGDSEFRFTVPDARSVHDLIGGLINPSGLFTTTFTGGTDLVLQGIEVADELFGLPVDAQLILRASELGSVAVQLIEQNIGSLSNFQNLSFEQILNELLPAVESYVEEMQATMEDAFQLIRTRTSDIIDTSIDGFSSQLEEAIGDVQELQDNLFSLQRFTQYLNQEFEFDVAGFDFSVTTQFDGSTNLLDVNLDVTNTENNFVLVGFNVSQLAGNTATDGLAEGGELATDAVIGWDASVNISLDTAFDLSNPISPVPYLMDTSEIVASLGGAADFASTVSAMGVLGLGADGLVTISSGREQGETLGANPAPATLTVSLAPDSVDGRYGLNELGNANPSVDLDAALDIDLTLTVLPVEATSQQFRMEITDLANPGQSSNVQELPDFDEMLEELGNITNNLSALVSGLDSILTGIENSFRGELFGLKIPVIEEVLQGPANAIGKFHAAIQPALDAIINFDAREVEEDIETALESVFGNLVDVELTLGPETTLAITPASMFPLDQVTMEYSNNFGMPGLGAELNADLDVFYQYFFDFTMGVSEELGVFLKTEVDNEISVETTVEFTGDMTGRLGFLSAGATVPASASTVFDGAVRIDLKDPNNDGRLTLGELASTDFKFVQLEVEGNVDLDLEFFVEAASFLPSIGATLEIDWTHGLPPTAKFTDVYMPLDGLLDNLAGEFLSTLETVIAPIRPVIDVLTDPVPILSDLLVDAGLETDPVNLLRLAEILFPNVNTDFVTAVQQVAELSSTVTTVLDAIQRAPGENIRLAFGSINFGNTDLSVEDALDGLDNLGEFTLPQNPLGQLAESVASDIAGALGFGNGAGEPGGSGEPGLAQGFSIPVLENPAQLLELIVGFRDDVGLIAWDIPELNFFVPIDISFAFPPFPALQMGFYGGIGLEADLNVGYDTVGIVKFLDSRNPLDLADGFFVGDTELPDGEGEDVPELSVFGEAKFQASVGVPGVAKAGVAGGLVATIYGDLFDTDGDGKLRGNEFLSPDGCIISLLGEMAIELDVFVETIVTGRSDYPFGHFVVGDFPLTPNCPFQAGLGEGEADLAELKNGTLNLFVGSNAGKRTVLRSISDEAFTVHQEGQTLFVSAFGKLDEFEVSRVERITAFAGDGHDFIVIDPSVTIPTEIHGGPGNDILYGGNGQNELLGDGGNDTLIGGPLRDRLDGGSDHNIIEGRAGDDTISARDGNDQVDAGDGDDTITIPDGNNFILGGPGNDTVNTGPGEDEIHGGIGEDTIDSGPGDDIIFGGPDGDMINARSGSDEVFGGPGDDQIDGGEDDDTLVGEDGRDAIRAGTGNDLILGGNDRDSLEGQEGLDVIRGGPGMDLIFGGPDEDELHGEEDNDTINGGDQNDVIFGGAGNDSIRGGNHDDEIHGEDGDDTLRGEAGSDWIGGGLGNDTIRGGLQQDQLFGGLGNDVIHGDAGNDEIHGDKGDDRLFGGFGGDSIHGDDGDDRIEGNNGNDTIDGGRGDDTILGGNQADFIHAGPGNDTIEGGNQDDEIFGEQGEDLVYGGNGSDFINGGDDNDILRGQLGHDTIQGGAGDDLIIGNEGDDLLFGNRGMDVIYAGLGNDEAAGGDDDDRMFGDYGDDVLEGGRGDDLLEGEHGNDTLEGNEGHDQLFGGEGTDNLEGDEGDDHLEALAGVGNVLRGDDGNDLLVGAPGGKATFSEGGGDALFGGDGSDTLRGLGGGDDLDGGEGDDILDGGPDQDRLNGGPGNNTLYDASGDLNVGEGKDNVADRPAVPLRLGSGETGKDRWIQLSGSATDNGISQVGGLEQAVMQMPNGDVYVTWVDSRNGNHEVYLARHSGDGWQEVDGSASGGGISDSTTDSRHPQLTRMGSTLVIAWVELGANSDSLISFATLENDTLSMLAGPSGVNGASIVKLAETNVGITAAWLKQVGGRQHAFSADYGSFSMTWTSAANVTALADPQMDVHEIAFDALETGRVLVSSHGGIGAREILLQTGLGNTWLGSQTISVQGDNHHPAVSMKVNLNDFNSPEFDFDYFLAWQEDTNTGNQVRARKSQNSLIDPTNNGLYEMHPHFAAETSARNDVDSISDTLGYAGKPVMSQSDGQMVWLSWLDDDVRSADLAGDGRNAIYAMVTTGTTIFNERQPIDATQGGISATGGSTRSLAMSHLNGQPTIAWNESSPGIPQVYLRLEPPTVHDFGEACGVPGHPLDISIDFPTDDKENELRRHILSATIEWGDGTTQQLGEGDSLEASHNFSDLGTYDATITMTNAVGEVVTGTLRIEMKPLVIEVFPPEIAEGEEVTLRGEFAPNLPNDFLKVTWGDSPIRDQRNIAIGETSFELNHTYADDPRVVGDEYTITARMEESLVDFIEQAIKVIVTNVAPTFEAGVDTTLATNADTFSREVKFDDVGIDDTHAATIDWGDEQIESLDVDASTNTVHLQHNYAEPGSYDVLLTIEDDDGGTHTDGFRITVEAAVAPSPYVFINKFFAGDADAGDSFGYDIAFDGTRAVIGAPADDEVAEDAGAVYIFERDSDKWNQTAKLVAADGAEKDAFGSAVSMVGTTIVVGAPTAAANGFESGSVYVFNEVDSSWKQSRKIIGSQTEKNERFGHAVHAAKTPGGDTLLVVGAPFRAASAGDVYVFRGGGSSWTEEALLRPSDRNFFDRTGISVHTDGQSIIAGAQRDEVPNGTSSGSAYVFTQKGGSWTEEVKLFAEDGEPFDNFGDDVLINGDIAIVSAPQDSANNINDRGTVYVFDRTAGWKETDRLEPTGDKVRTFGESLSFDGETLVIGAHLSHFGRWIGAGVIYTAAISNGDWKLEESLGVEDAKTSHWFGYSVAVREGEMLITALNDDEITKNAGSTYFYRIEELTKPVVVPGDVGKPDGIVNFQDFLIIAINFGKTEATIADGDVDGDGTVGFFDFLLLAQNFGKRAP